MNILFEDYAFFKTEQIECIETLINNNSLVFNRMVCIFDVLDYLLLNKDIIDEDTLNIFKVGYYYLYDSFNKINIFLDIYFNKNYDLFLKYDKIINCILIVDELISDATASKIDVGNLHNVNETLENILRNKEDIDNSIYLYVQDELDKFVNSYEIVNGDYFSIIDAFVETGEELNIYSYVEEEEQDIFNKI